MFREKLAPAGIAFAIQAPVGVLHIVDLAGSERTKISQAQGTPQNVVVLLVGFPFQRVPSKRTVTPTHRDTHETHRHTHLVATWGLQDE